VKTEDVSLTYVLALAVVVLITVVCLLALIALSIVEPNPTDSQSTVMDIVGHGFTAGLGGLLGILGGKLA
jgi:hypothetical protein